MEVSPAGSQTFAAGASLSPAWRARDFGRQWWSDGSDDRLNDGRGRDGGLFGHGNRPRHRACHRPDDQSTQDGCNHAFPDPSHGPFSPQLPAAHPAVSALLFSTTQHSPFIGQRSCPLLANCLSHLIVSAGRWAKTSAPEYLLGTTDKEPLIRGMVRCKKTLPFFRFFFCSHISQWGCSTFLKKHKMTDSWAAGPSIPVNNGHAGLVLSYNW